MVYGCTSCVRNASGGAVWGQSHSPDTPHSPLPQMPGMSCQDPCPLETIMFFLTALPWDAQLCEDAEFQLEDKNEVFAVFIDSTPFHLNTRLIYFPFPLCCRIELDKTLGNSSNESQVYMALSTLRELGQTRRWTSSQGEVLMLKCMVTWCHHAPFVRYMSIWGL